MCSKLWRQGHFPKAGPNRVRLRLPTSRPPKGTSILEPRAPQSAYIHTHLVLFPNVIQQGEERATSYPTSIPAFHSAKGQNKKRSSEFDINRISGACGPKKI